jgi:hypothetical protein
MEQCNFLLTAGIMLLAHFSQAQSNNSTAQMNAANEQRASLSKQQKVIQKQKEMLGKQELAPNEQKSLLQAQEIQGQRQKEMSIEQRQVMDTLKDKLIKDGFINPGAKYSFELNKERLIVNGVKQPDDVHKNYIKLINEKRKMPFGEKEQWNIQDN